MIMTLPLSARPLDLRHPGDGAQPGDHRQKMA
jgi:hypothetical protein